MQTYGLDRRVRKCTRELNDSQLQAKFIKGDLIAQDIVYHATCLLNLYRRANKASLGKSYSEDERRYNGIALSQLASFMEEAADTDENDQTKMYANFLAEFGLQIERRINSTHIWGST